MQKIKIVTWLISYLVGLVFLAEPVMAIVPIVSIQDLPSYVSKDNFLLSCSSLGGNSIQFSFRKEGGSYQNFGGAIDVTSNPCQIQVTSSQISEQAKFYFRATLDGALTDETSTIYDVAGPSPVSGYKTDGGPNNTIVIHWRNPDSEDLAKVIIYRGETVDFSADGNHEIATVTGSPNSEMTYSVNIPDTSKTYYYALRAVDKAGNSSSLVGDGSSTITTTTSQGTAGASTGGSRGSVLGAESVNKLPVESASPSAETESEESESQSSEESSEANRNKTWRNIGIGAALALLAYFILKRMEKI